MNNGMMISKPTGPTSSDASISQAPNPSDTKFGNWTEQKELKGIFSKQDDPARYLDELVSDKKISKNVALVLLSEHFGVAFTEYDEMILKPAYLPLINIDSSEKPYWFPIAVRASEACIATSNPRDPALVESVRKALKVAKVRVLVTLPSDIKRLIENSQDVNPGFPASAGRTPLARMRTYLAEQRTLLAQYRTMLAKGRTGLAFIRTGLAFTSISLVLLRIFGIGILNLLEIVLLVTGMMMAIDGLKWYLPARKMTRSPKGPSSEGSYFDTSILAIDGLKWSQDKKRENTPEIDYSPTEPTFGTTIIEFDSELGHTTYKRTRPVEGAKDLRNRWNKLTPVMRRRFLAIDRTDLAEERTFLASYRTKMARARTGLAFTRTGIAFSGLGIALLRQFPFSAWNILDFALILMGITMTLEGFHWYIPGRQTSKESAKAIMETSQKTSIWDFIFRPFHKRMHLDDLPPSLTIKGSYAPGIWGTTGLALERTLIAERRNVKSRLRTIMARSRTGMSFIRTGASFFSIGMGLQVYFGSANLLWSFHNCALMAVGLFLITDGFYWHLPAEKTKKEFPYCFADMEIMFPDYATPSPFWKKVVFSHDDL